ncbi:hypothetical protein [Amycolatopsis plumensis]|uniref:hypothetical protein n=1 Tax=Amycolatopsis plumensis TaxID=236508 RepID=UPI00361448F0
MPERDTHAFAVIVHGTPAAITGFALAGADVGVGCGAELGAGAEVSGVDEGVFAASRTSADPPAEQAVSTAAGGQSGQSSQNAPHAHVVPQKFVFPAFCHPRRAVVARG